MYAGSLGDQQAPTANDRKVSFIISGKPAKDLFDSMAPDDKVTCSGERGARSRTKGHVWCQRCLTLGTEDCFPLSSEDPFPTRRCTSQA